MQTSVLSRCIWRPANFIAQLPLILFSTISSTISIMCPQFQRPITNLWGSFTQRESHRNMSNYSQQWNYRQFFFRSSLKLLGSECIQCMKLVLMRMRLSWLWLWWDGTDGDCHVCGGDGVVEKCAVFYQYSLGKVRYHFMNTEHWTMLSWGNQSLMVIFMSVVMLKSVQLNTTPRKRKGFGPWLLC